MLKLRPYQALQALSCSISFHQLIYYTFDNLPFLFGLYFL